MIPSWPETPLRLGKKGLATGNISQSVFQRTPVVQDD